MSKISGDTTSQSTCDDVTDQNVTTCHIVNDDVTCPTGTNASTCLIKNSDVTLSIPEFYSGRCVFVTGASGFIGKQLVEKLLRSCPDIQRVFLLLRSNKQLTAQARWQQIMSSMLFRRLKMEQPDVESKVWVIEGDIVENQLGISEDDQQRLISQVSVVFHLAATVSFNEPLRVAVNLNIMGLRRVLYLCKQMSKLQALVHVSTAYANCNIEHIKETVYEPPVAPNRILDAVQWMSNDVLDSITSYVIGQRPNTYTFTKAIAEQLLVDERGNIPTAIFRPAIVTASAKEPFPGWVDNFNGATGVMTAIGSGLVKAMYGGEDIVADLVPVDLTSNILIALGWSTATNRNISCSVPVYNFASSHSNNMKWKEVGDMVTRLFNKYPLESPAWIPKGYITNSWLQRMYSMHIEVYLRLFGIDILRRLFGKKPRLLRLHKTVCKMLKLMEYFTSHGWTWSSDNVQQLSESMSESDQQVFNFDMTSVHWSTYFENYCLGIRQYAMKQSVSTLPESRRTLRWLNMAERMLSIVSVVAISRFIISRSETASRLWKFMMSIVTSMLQKMPKITHS